MDTRSRQRCGACAEPAAPVGRLHSRRCWKGGCVGSSTAPRSCRATRCSWCMGDVVTTSASSNTSSCPTSAISSKLPTTSSGRASPLLPLLPVACAASPALTWKRQCTAEGSDAVTCWDLRACGGSSCSDAAPRGWPGRGVPAAHGAPHALPSTPACSYLACDPLPDPGRCRCHNTTMSIPDANSVLSTTSLLTPAAAAGPVCCWPAGL
mmetsp:Transcript_40538/g.90091  ORF Transcript_40538/g.90091 Transcript_40538/m.90091 type:complete len:209 (+) Transcript_40538:1347-1973(+)